MSRWTRLEVNVFRMLYKYIIQNYPENVEDNISKNGVNSVCINRSLISNLNA